MYCSNDPLVNMRATAAEALGDFKNSSAALTALSEAAASEKDQTVLDAINRHLIQGSAEYTSGEIKNTSVETFLDRMDQPQPGYDKFAAMHALGKKARDADPNTRRDILITVTKAMDDTSRSINQRFQCCYVISDCGDTQWVPQLVYVLDNDPSSIMRSVAAEALGYFKDCPAATDALREARRRETNQRVLDTIDRILNKN